MAVKQIWTNDAGYVNAGSLAGIDVGLSSPLLMDTGEVWVPTYQASCLCVAAGTYQLYATGTTDFFNMVGSNSAVIHITRIAMTATATANAIYPVLLNKRSSLGILGSAVLVPLTAVPSDSNDIAAYGVASTVKTANYGTLGTLVGQVRGQMLQFNVATQSATDYPAPNGIEWLFGTRNTKGLWLRNANEQIALNFNATNLPSGYNINIEIEWAEYPTP